MYKASLRHGQTAIVVVIIASVALVIGLAIYMYFQPLFTNYFLRLQIESILSREIASQRLNLISTSTEPGGTTLWLVYSSTMGIANHTYYIMISNVSVGEVGTPINCSRPDVIEALYCDPAQDKDGVICSNDDSNDMVNISVNPKDILLNPMGRGWIPLEDLHEIVFGRKLSTVTICSAKYGGVPQVLKIVLNPKYVHIKVYLLSFINNKFYVIQELRVS